MDNVNVELSDELITNKLPLDMKKTNESELFGFDPKDVNFVDDRYSDEWLDDDSVPDSEKLAFFESLNWQPAKNLATEYGITTEEQYQEFLKNQAQNKSNN